MQRKLVPVWIGIDVAYVVYRVPVVLLSMAY